MDDKKSRQLLPVPNLGKIIPVRGEASMTEEAAIVVARRVLIHLCRGSIDAAREALEEGWAAHRGDSEPLPEGTELLAVPLAQVLKSLGSGQHAHSKALRMLNLLEGAGIRTVGDLLRASQSELLLIPCIGHSSAMQLSRLKIELQQRIEQPRRV